MSSAPSVILLGAHSSLPDPSKRVGAVGHDALGQECKVKMANFSDEMEAGVLHSSPGLRDTGDVCPQGVGPGQGAGTPLQYSCLENPMDGGTW